MQGEAVQSAGGGDRDLELPRRRSLRRWRWWLWVGESDEEMFHES